MKKIISLLLMTVLCTTMFAQRGSQQGRGGRDSHRASSKKSTIFYIGPKAGFDFTTMTQPKECDLYDGMGMGFSAGAVAKARFGRASEYSPAGTGILGVGLELKYKQNAVKTIGTDEDGKENANLGVNYFEVPVYLQLYPFYKSNAMNSFYVELGPDFAGTLSRSPKSLKVMDPSDDYGSVTYNFDTDGSKLKGMDVRLMAGVGYEFAVSKNNKGETENLIGLNARYYMGTSKLASNFDSKMNTVEISLSWMFSLGKL